MPLDGISQFALPIAAGLGTVALGIRLIKKRTAKTRAESEPEKEISSNLSEMISELEAQYRPKFPRM